MFFLSSNHVVIKQKLVVKRKFKHPSTIRTKSKDLKKFHLYKPNSSKNMSSNKTKLVKFIQILVMVKEKS